MEVHKNNATARKEEGVAIHANTTTTPGAHRERKWKGRNGNIRDGYCDGYKVNVNI